MTQPFSDPSATPRTAVVTGATSGVGLATADRLARQGWAVAILAREPNRLEEARALLAAHGGRVLALSVDVADAAAVEAAAARVEDELGPLDAWVNNAMSTVVAPADQVTPEEYARVTATTYLSQVHGTLSALKRMKPRNRGAIVQVCSTLAVRPVTLQAPYSAAKAAVVAFTDAMRSELYHNKVDVSLTTVYLPSVNTPQTHWARNHSGFAQVIPDPLFDPRLCARAIVQGIETPERDIWVGRTAVVAAVGQTLLPGLSDRIAAQERQAMEGAPAPATPGNLFEPVPGPARIDGDATDRVIHTEHEFLTSRPRDLLEAGLAGGWQAARRLLGKG